MKKIAVILLPVLIVSMCWLSVFTPLSRAFAENSGDSQPVQTEAEADADLQTDNTENTDAPVDFNRKLLMKLGSQTVYITDAEGVTETQTIETMPMLKNNRTLVPLRFICEEILGCQVDYIAAGKTINLTRKDISAVVDLNSKVVEVDYSDGTSASPQMDQIPVVQRDYTYMPLRFFSELFGCTVDWQPADKSITILDYYDADAEIETVDRPVPQLVFDAFTVGQPKLTYTDSSYDKNGLKIIDRQWKINVGGKTYTGSELGNLKDRLLYSGTYTVYYRVQNSDKVWSLWTPFTLKAEANKAPVITGFSAVKASDHRVSIVNSGEAIDFVYNIENEEWEDIVEEKWSYTWTSSGYTKHMTGKPAVLFATDSPYVVTLKVKDAAGNWGSATAHVLPKDKGSISEAGYKFNKLVPGEVFLNKKGTNFNETATAEPQNIEFGKVTLLASNNPETVSNTCVLESDTISGDVRLRFHHKNNTGCSVKFYAVAKNETDHPVTIKVGQNAAAGPSLDVIQVGVTVVDNYMSKSYTPVTRVLQPGEFYLINQSAPAVKNGFSVAGLIDVSSDDPVTYTISCMNVSSSYKDYSYLPNAEKNSTHVRGTFAESTINMDYTFSGKKTEKIVLGRADAFDGYFRTGIDAMTGDFVINNGNRGVVHNMTVTAKGKIGLLFNPRGTSYKGVIMIDGKVIDLSVAGMMAGISEGCILDVMEAGETKDITYIVPSGSDSPVLLVAIPESQWNNY
ncbi:MAG: stalk domain-containing protein [Bacillota bacterium]|jgi:hypothetical protein